MKIVDKTKNDLIIQADKIKENNVFFRYNLDSNNQIIELVLRDSNDPSNKSLGNLVTEVPDDFKNHKNIKGLYIYNNQISTLPDFIQDFDSLEVLDFHDNPIDKLPEWVGKLKNLKRLNLSKTNIKTLPKSIADLPHLEAIIFNDTHIEGFPEELYTLKNSLKELMLNEVEQLPEEVTEFKELLILGGKIHSFKYLDKIPLLRDIIINDSKAKSFSYDFGPIHHLCYLVLRNCKFINRLPNSLGKGENLGEYLRFVFDGSEKLQGLPMTFQGKKIISLRINRCPSFSFMPGDMYIGTFEAHENYWHSMPKNFYKNNVDSFEMYDHNVMSLRGIGNFKSLRYLLVADGNIHKIPDEICNCKKLISIDVSGNPIKYIPDCLEDLEELGNVYVQNTTYWEENGE